MRLILAFALLLPFSAFSSAKFSVGTGLWAFFDEQDMTALHLVYEYPDDPNLFHLRPTFLAVKMEEGHSYYALGLTKRLDINDTFSWGVGSNVGFLDESHELGHKLEFYTRAFIEYKLTEQSSIELEIGHISNAGFGDINPGSESLVLSYSHSI